VTSSAIEAHGRTADLIALLNERMVVLDGAWGTMLQNAGLTPDDYLGPAVEGHEKDVTGDPDLLNITRPDIIKAIHAEYLDAGADIIETNTFSTQIISLADYKLEELAY